MKGVAQEGCSWTFWFLQKSKKVWFRLPEEMHGREQELMFTYNDRPIIHRADWKTMAPEEKEEDTHPFLWGDEVASGWGHGPAETNHYLYIWTRWSLVHPRGCGQPDRFAIVLKGS
jgi:hypothetical protein